MQSSIGAVMLIKLERLGEPSYSFFFVLVGGNQEEPIFILTATAMTTYNKDHDLHDFFYSLRFKRGRDHG